MIDKSMYKMRMKVELKGRKKVIKLVRRDRMRPSA